MKRRLLSGWNMQRSVFLIIGMILLLHTIMDNQPIGILLGIYITGMGLFGFGCAAGNCSVDKSQN
tara:strand:+ start:58501 stop:58695 length:195 start_codon:yes stop_codon:yes gene_type:complete